MAAWRSWLRTVPGQLTLLAVTFGGAVVLAVVIVCLRNGFFERHVHEVYLPAEGWAEEAAKTLANPNVGEARIEELGKDLKKRQDGARVTKQINRDLEMIYGAWMLAPDLDPERVLPGRLTRLQPEWVLERLRQTLATGRPDQRARALEWLDAIVDDPNLGSQGPELAEAARRRAAARGETDLQHRAEAVRAKGRRAAADP